jgi:ATP-dependent DNA helicase DinG
VAGSPRTAVTGGHAWTSEADDELRDAVLAGIDLEQLVEHFDLPAEAITARMAQLGLTLSDPQLGL